MMEEFLKKYSNVPKGFITDFFRISKETYDIKDFVVKLDIVSKWLKIRKDSLKRTLIANFDVNYDFTINKKNSNNKGNVAQHMLK